MNIHGRFFTFFSLFLVGLCLAGGCSGAKASSENDSTGLAGYIDKDGMIQGLRLPEPPAGLSPEETHVYVLQHFWDDLDFNDTILSLNPDFMDLNMANYSLYLLQTPDTAARNEAVKAVVKRAESNPMAYAFFTSLARHYLYDPNSPYYDEEAFIPFLRELSKSELLDEAQRGRFGFLLECALKNRPGSQAADFTYITREGEVTSLYDTPVSGNLLLVFYDPDCDNCKDIMKKLADWERLNTAISNGEVSVLAVYSGDDGELWESTAMSLPANWTVGFDNGSIDEADSYYFQASPTLYILDSDKRVVAKDVPPSQFFE